MKRQRLIILGLPGAGTSFWAQTLVSMGWVSPPPYEGRRPYPTFESRDLREVNERMMPGGLMTPDRFKEGFVVKEPDEETVQLAQRFVLMSSGTNEKFFLKNPESTLTFERMWSRWDWDHVVGVYREPTANVTSLWKSHLASSVRRTRRVTHTDLAGAWLRWNASLVKHATLRVRFPPCDDHFARFCEAIGDVPDDSAGFDADLVHSEEPDHIPNWAADMWRELEA